MRTLARFLQNGMGLDGTAAATLLLKGSFCAAPSPSLCLRVVSGPGRVGRQSGIEWEAWGGCGGWGGGASVLV